MAEQSNNRDKDMRTLVFAASATTLGSTATWTGLPIFIADLTGNLHHTAGLFLCETVASILISIWGGYLADRLSRKTISVSASSLSLLLMLALWLGLSPEHVWLFYTVGILNSLGGAVGFIAQNAWFNNLALEGGTLLQSMGSRGAFLSASKLVGMSLGPALFTLIGAGALLVSAGCFLLGALLYLTAQKPPASLAGKKDLSGVLGEVAGGFRQLWQEPRHRALLLVAALSGSLSFPIVNACVYTLKSVFDASAGVVSAYWLIGSVGSLLSNLLLSRNVLKRFDSFRLFLITNGVMAVGFLLMSVANSSWMFIASVTLFTMANPIVYNLVIAELFRRAHKEMQGRVTAAQMMANDLASMIGLLLFSALTPYLVMPLMFLFALPLVLLRSVVARRALGTAESSNGLAS